jgi:hypothetical protein
MIDADHARIRAQAAFKRKEEARVDGLKAIAPPLYAQAGAQPSLSHRRLALVPLSVMVSNLTEAEKLRLSS